MGKSFEVQGIHSDVRIIHNTPGIVEGPVHLEGNEPRGKDAEDGDGATLFVVCRLWRCLDFILSGKALECYGKDLGDEMKRVCVCVCVGAGRPIAWSRW